MTGSTMSSHKSLGIVVQKILILLNNMRFILKNIFLERGSHHTIGTLFQNVDDITRAIHNLNNLVNVMNIEKQ